MAHGDERSAYVRSSGAILALKVVADGVAIERLYLYEPPFRFAENQPASPPDLPARPQALLDGGGPGGMVATFQLEGVGLPEEVVNGIRQSPMWRQLEGMAQSRRLRRHHHHRPPASDRSHGRSIHPTLVLQGDPTWPFWPQPPQQSPADSPTQ